MGRKQTIDRELARVALKATSGNVEAAAKMMKVGRTTLLEALRTYLADVGREATALREAAAKVAQLARRYTPEEIQIIREVGYRDAIAALGLTISPSTLQRQVRKQLAEEELGLAEPVDTDPTP